MNEGDLKLLPPESPAAFMPEARRRIAPLPLGQKARLLAGMSFWRTAAIEEAGIASQTLSDGPHGLRKQQGVADNLGLSDSIPATCFPTASALACSFDPDLVREVGRALGEECRKEDVSVLLGPGVNLKRSPLCGRNFEYFSEDPLVAGHLAAAYVQGVQSQGVGASLKHFAANNQEKARLVSDSVVDERTLHELYLRPFELAVRIAQPWTVMTAYNRLNGVYCSQNEELIHETLRHSWGFEGAVITDWGALSDSVASVRAGLDLCMPGPREDHITAVCDAVTHHCLPEAVLDEAAARVAALALAHERVAKQSYECSMVKHASLARRAAAESAVLLKNDGTLPLRPGQRVAVIGAFAKSPRYQGAGSSKINPFDLDDTWSSLLEAGVSATFSLGYEAQSGSTSEDLLVQAEEAARAADVAVVFAGLPDRFESEGYDRTSLGMPAGHSLLIERVCRANPNTAVVLCGGAPFELPWRSLPGAILLMYLAGAHGGAATADLLCGKAVPSGKLAETWPERLDDTALGTEFPDSSPEVCYREGIYVGYRYYDAPGVRQAGVAPAYPFGHGLSYARFAYGDVRTVWNDGQLSAQVPVHNEGPCDAAETVQIYVVPLDAEVFGPAQQLAGFTKVLISAGEKRIVEVPLDGHVFGFWDVEYHAWRIDEGRFEVRAAASSADVRSTCVVALGAGQWLCGAPGELECAGGNPVRIPVRPRAQVPDELRASLASYFWVCPHGFTQEGFRALYGRPFPKRPPTRPFTVDTLLGDVDQTAVGRRIVQVLQWYADTIADEQTKSMIKAMMSDSPLRAVLTAGVQPRFLHGLVHLLNGHPFRAVRTVMGKRS